MARRKKRTPPPAPGASPAAWARVHPHLDLHGHTGDEARRRAAAWLREQRGDGVRTVVVVTGRGLHSRGLPVLRGEVEDVLRSLEGTVVQDFEEAPGGGGYLVRLRRPPPPPLPAPPAPALPDDPALLREAQESLWELGIAPTPALLRAEAERIARERGGRAGP